MRSATKCFHPFDVEEIGSHACNLCTHAVEHVAKLLQVGFAGGIVDGGLAFGHHGCHHDVGGSSYGGLI